jgi:hypothetical protein
LAGKSWALAQKAERSISRTLAHRLNQLDIQIAARVAPETPVASRLAAQPSLMRSYDATSNVHYAGSQRRKKLAR